MTKSLLFYDQIIFFLMWCILRLSRVNRVIANFGHLQSHSLSQIFKTHCCTFYGSACGTLILKVLPKFVLLGIKVFALF